MNSSTIIIPNYNGILYLSKCLEALASEPADVLVVDNGSSDGSEKLVETSFPGVKQIRLEQNYGFCKAVNRGILECSTKYVILLNNDTQVLPGFVEQLERAMEADSRLFSGSARMLNAHHRELIDDTGDYYCALGWAFTLGKDKPADDYAQARHIFAACGGAAIYRRAALEQIGLFDEEHFAYLEDIDIGYRARIYGYTNVYVPQAEVLHYGSGTSGSRHNEFKVRLSSRNSIYLIYKNMPTLQVLLNLPFLIAGVLVKWLYFSKKGLGSMYAGGILNGIKLCFSKMSRRSKVHFEWRNFGNYLQIQLELWWNMVRRFTDC